MNLLFTGANGFIAQELIQRFKKQAYINNILHITRQNFNLLDPKSISNYLSKNSVDYIFHCAISGGRRGTPETADMFYDNLIMFENLASQNHRFKGMFSFGSGAEMDRTKDIQAPSEEQFLQNKTHPTDYYGLSKHIIARRIKQINDNIYNFRIFNVFGDLEKENRMIKNNINRNKQGLPFEIHQNKIMDFFSAEDLFRVIEYYIKNIDLKLDKDINICYINKVSLIDICKTINPHGKFNILKKGFAPSYCGDGSKLNHLPVVLVGLKRSIDQLRNK